jgi:hypothetical protein
MTPISSPPQGRSARRRPSNAADDLSPDRTLSNRFAVLRRPVHRNPNGGAAWIGAALIGIEAG